MIFSKNHVLILGIVLGIVSIFGAYSIALNHRAWYRIIVGENALRVSLKMDEIRIFMDQTESFLQETVSKFIRPFVNTKDRTVLYTSLAEVYDCHHLVSLQSYDIQNYAVIDACLSVLEMIEQQSTFKYLSITMIFSSILSTLIPFASHISELLFQSLFSSVKNSVISFCSAVLSAVSCACAVYIFSTLQWITSGFIPLLSAFLTYASITASPNMISQNVGQPGRAMFMLYGFIFCSGFQMVVWIFFGFSQRKQETAKLKSELEAIANREAIEKINCTSMSVVQDASNVDDEVRPSSQKSSQSQSSSVFKRIQREQDVLASGCESQRIPAYLRGPPVTMKLLTLAALIITIGGWYASQWMYILFGKEAGLIELSSSRNGSGITVESALSEQLIVGSLQSWGGWLIHKLAHKDVHYDVVLDGSDDGAYLSGFTNAVNFASGSSSDESAFIQLYDSSIEHDPFNPNGSKKFKLKESKIEFPGSYQTLHEYCYLRRASKFGAVEVYFCEIIRSNLHKVWQYIQVSSLIDTMSVSVMALLCLFLLLIPHFMKDRPALMRKISGAVLMLFGFYIAIFVSIVILFLWPSPNVTFPNSVHFGKTAIMYMISASLCIVAGSLAFICPPTICENAIEMWVDQQYREKLLNAQLEQQVIDDLLGSEVSLGSVMMDFRGPEDEDVLTNFDADDDAAVPLIG